MSRHIDASGRSWRCLRPNSGRRHQRLRARSGRARMTAPILHVGSEFASCRHFEEEAAFPGLSALGVCLLSPDDRIIMRAAWLKRRW
jgi:hypothetical protein